MARFTVWVLFAPNADMFPKLRVFVPPDYDMRAPVVADAFPRVKPETDADVMGRVCANIAREFFKGECEVRLAVFHEPPEDPGELAQVPEADRMGWWWDMEADRRAVLPPWINDDLTGAVIPVRLSGLEERYGEQHEPRDPGR